MNLPSNWKKTRLAKFPALLYLLDVIFCGIRYNHSLNRKRSQVPGSTFRVRDKDKIEDPKSS
jgi:hypothetical protein